MPHRPIPSVVGRLMRRNHCIQRVSKRLTFLRFNSAEYLPFFTILFYYFRKLLAILRIAGSSWPLHYLYSGVPARGNAQPKSPLCGVTKIANNTNLRGPHVARQQQLSIDICCPCPNTAANPPGRRCCCRSIGQMDGRTDGRVTN